MQEECLMESVEAVEKILKYSFLNKNLLKDTLKQNDVGRQPLLFRRLEFLGDSVLGFVFTNYFHLTFPSLKDNELRELQRVNVCNDKFACVAVKRGLLPFVICNSWVGKIKAFSEAVSKDDDLVWYQGSMEAPKILADFVEAIAGAVYINVNFDVLRFWEILKGLLEPLFMPDDICRYQPVVMLRRMSKKRKRVVFKYCNEDETRIVAKVYFDGKIIAYGHGKTVDSAKIAAAKEALQKLSECMLSIDERSSLDVEKEADNGSLDLEKGHGDVEMNHMQTRSCIRQIQLQKSLEVRKNLVKKIRSERKKNRQMKKLLEKKKNLQMQEECFEEKTNLEMQESLEDKQKQKLQMLESLKEKQDLQTHESLEEKHDLTMHETLEENPSLQMQESLEEKTNLEMQESLEEKTNLEMQESLEEKPNLQIQEILEEKHDLQMHESSEEKHDLQIQESLEEKPNLQMHETLEVKHDPQMNESSEEKHDLQIQESVEEWPNLPMHETLEEKPSLQMQESLEEKTNLQESLEEKHDLQIQESSEEKLNLQMHETLEEKHDLQMHESSEEKHDLRIQECLEEKPNLQMHETLEEKHDLQMYESSEEKHDLQIQESLEEKPNLKTHESLEEKQDLQMQESLGNKKNLQMDSWEALEKILNYSFSNKSLLKETITHKSGMMSRLKILGDTALGLAFTKYLYFMYPNLSTLGLSRLLSVNKSFEKSARVALKHGLDKFLILDRSFLLGVVSYAG